MANKYIKNFQKHTPDVPQYSDRNQNYLIAGANPTYYMDTSGTQEEQFAPLAASARWTTLSLTLDGNVVHMISSTDSTQSVYLVTDTTHVYSIDTSYALHDLGYPTGASISNTGLPVLRESTTDPSKVFSRVSTSTTIPLRVPCSIRLSLNQPPPEDATSRFRSSSMGVVSLRCVVFWACVLLLVVVLFLAPILIFHSRSEEHTS